MFLGIAIHDHPVPVAGVALDNWLGTSIPHNGKVSRDVGNVVGSEIRDNLA